MPETIVGNGRVGRRQLDQAHFTLSKGKTRHWIQGGADTKTPGLLHHLLQADALCKAKRCCVAAGGEGLVEADLAFARAIEALSSPAHRAAVNSVCGLDPLFQGGQECDQFEGAAWLPLGHGGTVELAAAVILATGNRQDTS